MLTLKTEGLDTCVEVSTALYHEMVRRTVMILNDMTVVLKSQGKHEHITVERDDSNIINFDTSSHDHPLIRSLDCTITT